MATTVETNTVTDKRTSNRFSTYSMTPTLAPSIAPSRLSQHSNTSSTPSEKTTTSTNNPLAADMKSLQSGLARLDDPKMQRQRYEASDSKREEISKLALGAKLEKALGRRMTGQDAYFTKDIPRVQPAAPLVERAPILIEQPNIPVELIGIAR